MPSAAASVVQVLNAFSAHVDPAPEIVTNEAADADCAGRRIAADIMAAQLDAARAATQPVRARRRLVQILKQRTQSTARVNGMGGLYAPNRKLYVYCA